MPVLCTEASQPLPATSGEKAILLPSCTRSTEPSSIEVARPIVRSLWFIATVATLATVVFLSSSLLAKPVLDISALELSASTRTLTTFPLKPDVSRGVRQAALPPVSSSRRIPADSALLAPVSSKLVGTRAVKDALPVKTLEDSTPQETSRGTGDREGLGKTVKTGLGVLMVSLLAIFTFGFKAHSRWAMFATDKYREEFDPESGADSASAASADEKRDVPQFFAEFLPSIDDDWSELNSKTAQDGLGTGIPDTPAALLNMTTSKEYTEAADAMWDSVTASYQLLDHCPFFPSKPLYVLASEGDDEGFGQGYTLRATVQDEQQAELNKLMGWSKDKLKCYKKVDAVVAFESKEDAEVYSQNSGEDWIVFEDDCYELFNHAHQVKAWVVLVKHQETGFVPEPYQLTASLLGAKDGLLEG